MRLNAMACKALRRNWRFHKRAIYRVGTVNHRGVLRSTGACYGPPAMSRARASRAGEEVFAPGRQA